MPLQVLCPDHWSMVPDDLRQAVKQAKRRRGSPQWEKACKDAVTFVQGTISDRREAESWVHKFGEGY